MATRSPRFSSLQVVDTLARDPEQVQKVCLWRSLYGRPSGSKIKR